VRVVIPVANEAKNLSLPHAINSIRKHTDLEPVTYGMKDYGLCTHIHVDEPRDTKFANEARVMRTAIDRIGEAFIWSNDDIYWLRPAEPVRWALGQLDNDFGATIYQKRKHTTWQTLRAHSLPTWDYESHTPLPVTDLHTMTIALNMTGAMRSLYGNLTGTPDLVAPDVKLRRTDAPLPDAAWVSTHHDPGLYRNLRHDLAAL
jgi:hypothetical protein